MNQGIIELQNLAESKPRSLGEIFGRHDDGHIRYGNIMKSMTEPDDNRSIYEIAQEIESEVE